LAPGLKQAYGVDTLGGLIVGHFGHIPKINAKMTLGHLTLEILEVSRRRVRRVLVKVSQNPSEAEMAQGFRSAPSTKSF